MTNDDLRQHIRQYYALGFDAFPFKLERDKRNPEKKHYVFRNADGETLRWQEDKSLIDLEYCESILDRVRCTALAAYCGAEHNLICVDIDRKNGKDGFTALTDLGILIPDNIPAVSTPSGGLHYLFKFPDELKKHQTFWQFKNGIDIQGENSITILPPSAYPGGAYEWITPIHDELPKMPNSLLSWLTKNLPPKGQKTATGLSANTKTVFDEPTQVTTSVAEVELPENDIYVFLPSMVCATVD